MQFAALLSWQHTKEYQNRAKAYHSDLRAPVEKKRLTVLNVYL